MVFYNCVFEYYFIKMPRPTLKVYKKRKPVFSGVQRHANKKVTTDSQLDVSESNVPEPRPSPSVSDPRPKSPAKNESSSKKKVGSMIQNYDLYTGEDDDNDIGLYDLVNFKNMTALLNKISVCSRCQGSLSIFPSNRKGLSCTVNIICNDCKYTVSMNNSKKIPKGPAEVNVRLAYGFRCIGKGEQAARTVCAVMNMPQAPEFRYYKNILCEASKEVCMESMRDAVQESIEMNEGEKDITAIFDGTWQRRGHSSLNGVVTAISGLNGKVIDCRVLSKYCRCKGRLQNKHIETCVANFSGSSGGMEVEGVVDMFKTSEDTYGIRYKYYLGDGDSASFPRVVAEKPYGPDFIIEKQECVGHVQKRMGSRLRTLKNKSAKNLLSDGKTIGGTGRLSGAAIKKIQEYYGNAIRRNSSSLEDMKKAVWAEYFHILASDATPENHNLCPKGPGTWCKYQKSIITEEPYNHSKHFHLPEAVMTAIKPIFQDLSSPDLLRRCLHGGTQNPCESLNNIIWSRIPKTTFVLKTTLELGVYEAIASFNRGNIVKCELLAKLGISPGRNCVKFMRKADEMRIKKAEKNFQEYEKKCRKQAALAKRRLEDQLEEAEDPDNPSYAPGHY